MKGSTQLTPVVGNETTRPNPTPTRRAACERCRAAKVRCLKHSSNESDKCRRCEMANAECSFAPIVTRRRRKRTDARVTALEQELRRIKSSMQAPGMTRNVNRHKFAGNLDIDGSSSLERSSIAVEHATSPSSSDTRPLSQRSSSGATSSANEDALPGLPATMLSSNEAIKCFAEFRDDVLPRWPIIDFKGISFDLLKQSKPILLMAAVTAAIGAKDAVLFHQLHSRLVSQLVTRIFTNGEANVELVQAILVMQVWYCTLKNEPGSGFYQWIHVAATMALQIGLGGDSRSDHDIEDQKDEREEESRTLLAVYLSCSCVAVSMRRENVLGLTPCVQNALDRLNKHATTVNDRRLLAWIRLQLIAEEGQGIAPNQNHLYDRCFDSQMSLASEMSRLKRQYEHWRNRIDEDIMNEPLMVHYIYLQARLHEIPVYRAYELKGLVPPFLSASSLVPRESSNELQYSLAISDGIQAYVRACHEVLDTVLSINPEILRKCPTVVFSRALYPINALMMFEGSPGLLSHLRGGYVCVERYHELLRSHLNAVTGEDQCENGSMGLQMLERTSEMYQQQVYTSLRSNASQDEWASKSSAESSFELNVLSDDLGRCQSDTDDHASMDLHPPNSYLMMDQIDRPSAIVFEESMEFENGFWDISSFDLANLVY